MLVLLSNLVFCFVAAFMLRPFLHKMAGGTEKIPYGQAIACQILSSVVSVLGFAVITFVTPVLGTLEHVIPDASLANKIASILFLSETILVSALVTVSFSRKLSLRNLLLALAAHLGIAPILMVSLLLSGAGNFTGTSGQLVIGSLVLVGIEAGVWFSYSLAEPCAPRLRKLKSRFSKVEVIGCGEHHNDADNIISVPSVESNSSELNH